MREFDYQRAYDVSGAVALLVYLPLSFASGMWTPLEFLPAPVQAIAPLLPTQREFAAMAGTSASRLSTYVNGLVTPSATMMVRIRRVSELVQTRRANGSSSYRRR